MEYPRHGFIEPTASPLTDRRIGRTPRSSTYTTKAGADNLAVPLVQMNALLGFVADALTYTILGLGLPRAREVQTVRAFNRLLWLQNDLINRHYQEEKSLRR